MHVTENGVPIPELIETIKQAIKTANVSSTDTAVVDRDLSCVVAGHGHDIGQPACWVGLTGW